VGDRLTTIGPVTLSVPSEYRRSGWDVTVTVLQASQALFTSLHELFGKCSTGTALHSIPGAYPQGEDMSADEVNTQYCDFTDGTTGKPVDGWYLLRGFSYMDDESPEGHEYTITLSLYLLGTNALYECGELVIDLEEETNDWNI